MPTSWRRLLAGSRILWSSKLVIWAVERALEGNQEQVYTQFASLDFSDA